MFIFGLDIEGLVIEGVFVLRILEFVGGDRGICYDYRGKLWEYRGGYLFLVSNKSCCLLSIFCALELYSVDCVFLIFLRFMFFLRMRKLRSG